jgi:hypothetical protein
MNSEYVLGVSIDVCARKFFLYGDGGDERVVECETTEEFMNVLNVVTTSLDPDQIQYHTLK